MRARETRVEIVLVQKNCESNRITVPNDLILHHRWTGEKSRELQSYILCYLTRPDYANRFHTLLSGSRLTKPPIFESCGGRYHTVS